MSITTSRLEISRGSLAFFEALPEADIKGTVLMVPGYTGSKEDFLPMAPFVTAAGYRLLSYSQLGQFDSDGPDGEGAESEYTIEKFASDLGEAWEQMADGERIHLVGHSFGGFVTRRAVLDGPGRFLDYTILDSGPDRTGVGMPVVDIPGLIRAGGNEAMWQQMFGTLENLFPAPLRDFLHGRIMATRSANLVGIAESMATEPDRTAELAAAGVPMLVAYGENDFAWPASVLADYADRLGAQHAVIAGAGHTPNEEAPELLSGILADFWDLHEA